MEQYGFKFVVDANDAAKGWKQFETAVEGVFHALDKMESHVKKTMGAVDKATSGTKTKISAFTKAANELGRIKVNPSAARNIQTISNAMKAYKAPSATQVKNTQAFFRALEKAGTGGGATAGRNITILAAAMNGFKAPTSGNIKNLRDLFAALKTYPSGKNFTNAAGLLGTLRQLSTFKAPSAAQVRNLQNFLNVVANLRIPANGSQLARVLEAIARASSTASTHLRGLRGALGSMPWRSFNTGAQSARLNMMGLQNAFSGTFQVGSALRVLLGSLTIGELGRNYFEATNAALQFNAQMSVVNKEASFAGIQLDYVNSMANRFGVDALAAANGFAKISIAADKSGISVAETRHIFEGMTTAMSVLGITTAGQGDVWLALQQVMNKGYLSAEELNQQLNEKLPGAMAYATEYAESLGTTLEKGLKTKALDAAGVLAHISQRMKEDFGPAVAAALERPSAQMNILKNNFTMLFQEIGANGGNEAFVDLLKAMNEQMTPEKIQQYAVAIGEGLKTAVDKVAGAFQWLHDNWDSIKGPLAATLELMGRWMIISSALQIGRFIVQPLMMIGGALTGLKAAGAAMTSLMAVARAGSLMAMITAAQGLSGVTAVVATRMIALRNAITMAGVAARGTAGANGLLAASLRGVAAAGGLAIAGMKGLYAALGGPILALAAMAYAGYKMYDGISEGNKVVRESNTIIQEQRVKIDEAAQSIYINTAEVRKNAGGQRELTGTISSANTFLDDYTRKLDEATNGLYSMAVAAKAAALETAQLARSRIAAQLADLTMQDPTALMEAGDRIGNDESRGWANRKFLQGTAYMGAGLEWLQDVTTLNSQTPEVRQRRLASTRQELREQDAILAAITGKDEMDIVAEMQARGYNGATPRTRTPSGDDSGSSRRERQPPDPARELDRLQRKADQLMNRISEFDPIKRLNQDFINSVTETSQALLSDSGHAAWTEAMKTNTDGVTGAMDLLRRAFRAGGQDVAVMKDLAKRYGVTMADITDMIYEQEEAYEQLKKEAEEEVTFGFGMRKEMGESLQLAMLGNEEAEVQRMLQAEILRMKKLQREVDQGAIDAAEEEIRLWQQKMKYVDAQRKFYEGNGLRQYTKEIQTAGEAVHDLDYNALRSLEDQLVSLGTTGKFSFGAIFDTINQGMIKFAAQGITGKVGEMLSDKDSQNPSIFGRMFRSMGFGTGFDEKNALERIQAQTVNLYAGAVNGTGDLLTGPLGAKFAHKGAIGKEIVVNGGIQGPQDLADIVGTPMEDAASQVGDVMKNEWGRNITGLGSLMQSIFQGIGGNGQKGSGIFNALLGVGMSFLGGGAAPSAALAGDVTSAMAANPGIFKEGGLSTQPVAWAKAPHYSEGTANTSGGIPAVLHDNEAVIPLSRNRKVPVQLTNGSGGGSGTNITNVWNVQTPNADSFKRSQQQMSGQMHRAASRAAMRNH